MYYRFVMGLWHKYKCQNRSKILLSETHNFQYIGMTMRSVPVKKYATIFKKFTEIPLLSNIRNVVKE